MRILLYADVHWSTNSSILRTKGKKYSIRLENLIQSVSWAEEISKKEKCDAVINLGDFFDKSIIPDIDITALQDVTWNQDIPHYNLVGNHESSVGSLAYNTVHALHCGNTPFIVISKPYKIELPNGALYFLPFITEDNRKPIKEYLTDLGYEEGKLNIVFSHNDLKGIQLGRVPSTVGFDVNEIEEICSLFINGHIHNSTWVTKKILNLGNLTGQNFGEDAEKYKHQVLILDTDTREVTFIENPYSLKFYQIDIESEKDLMKLENIESNAIVSFRCKESLYELLLDGINKYNNIIETKISIIRETTEEEVVIDRVEDFTIDHLQKFREFTVSKLGDDPIVQEELSFLGIQ